MRPQHLHAAPGVMDAAPDGGGGGDPDQEVANAIQSEGWEGVVAHPDDGGDDLEKSAQLSPDGRRDLAQPGESEGDPRSRQDEEVAAEDDGNKPPWDGGPKGKAYIYGAEEHLIGDGIEISAGGGSGSEVPGEGAIDDVGKSGGDGEPEGDKGSAVEDSVGDEGGEGDPRQRDQIRCQATQSPIFA